MSSIQTGLLANNRSRQWRNGLGSRAKISPIEKDLIDTERRHSRGVARRSSPHFSSCSHHLPPHVAHLHSREIQGAPRVPPWWCERMPVGSAAYRAASLAETSILVPFPPVLYRPLPKAVKFDESEVADATTHQEWMCKARSV
ncbi:hypothetical protein BJV78DRAFT_1153677 [Lactifluus subvellereus]|nr:hypothetical protein BJV78DRAFT_1153677 [Lactifluus subvellereus]